MSAAATVVMVPCEVPARVGLLPQPIAGYKSLVTAFWFGGAESVFVALPGRKSHTVADGFRRAVEGLGLCGFVAVYERQGGVYLRREGGDR